MRGKGRGNDLSWLERIKERRHGDALDRRHCGGVIQRTLFTVDIFILSMFVGSNCIILTLHLKLVQFRGKHVYKRMQGTKIYISTG